jgi:tRNA pseudouridine38-40 synthase
MRNIRMTIAYDGTNYVGWQVQPNGPTIQSTVERALAKLTGEDISVLSAGRTDSGVHALGQVASFKTGSSIPCEGFRKALVAHLPPDILIRDVAEAPPDFHATFTAKHKRYRYVIHNSRTRNPFLQKLAWHYHLNLDTVAMHAAAQELVGRHDFRSFESHWPNKATSVRTVMEVTIKRQRHCPVFFGEPDLNPSPDDAGDFVWIEIVADGFLYNMVRSIVGTLVPVGRGRWDATDLRRILKAMNRSEAGDTAPAHGLYMVEVTY